VLFQELFVLWFLKLVNYGNIFRYIICTVVVYVVPQCLKGCDWQYQTCTFYITRVLIIIKVHGLVTVLTVQLANLIINYYEKNL